MDVCVKRQRTEHALCMKNMLTDNNAACGQNSCPVCMESSGLLGVPREVLVQIFSYLDAPSLVAVSQCCKLFRGFDTSTGLRLVDTIAKAQVQSVAREQSDRWRRRSWLGKLFIEDCAVGFEGFQWSNSGSPTLAAGGAPQYRFLPPAAPGSYLNIKLDGMGPKLLVSDRSTADQPVLRWRLAVRGNTAVEFGVVPLNMVDDDKSLHKCHQEEKKFEKVRGPLADAERPTGFCSSITVGSMLPFKTAIMKGSVVELLARRGRLEIIVQNPPDGQELYWHNTRTVPKPYKGPKEVRFEQDFSPNHDVKLALTSWAHGAFDVLHWAPGSRLQPKLQQCWNVVAERCAVEDDVSEGSRGVKRSRSRIDAEAVQQQQQEASAALQQVVGLTAAPIEQILQHQEHPIQLQQQPAVPVPVQQPAADTADQPAAAGAAAQPMVVVPGSPASEESVSSTASQLLP